MPKVEQNIRLVEASNGYFLKQGGKCLGFQDLADVGTLSVSLMTPLRCTHVEGDDDPDMTPKEPKLAFPVDCASRLEGS